MPMQSHRPEPVLKQRNVLSNPDPSQELVVEYPRSPKVVVSLAEPNLSDSVGAKRFVKPANLGAMLSRSKVAVGIPSSIELSSIGAFAAVASGLALVGLFWSAILL